MPDLGGEFRQLAAAADELQAAGRYREARVKRDGLIRQLKLLGDGRDRRLAMTLLKQSVTIYDLGDSDGALRVLDDLVGRFPEPVAADKPDVVSRAWDFTAGIRFRGYNRMLWTALKRKAAYLPG